MRNRNSRLLARFRLGDWFEALAQSAVGGTSEVYSVCMTGELRCEPCFAPCLNGSPSGHGLDGVDGCCIDEVSGQGCRGEAFSYVAATLGTRGFAYGRGSLDGDLE